MQMNKKVSQIVKISAGFLLGLGPIACAASSHGNGSAPTQTSITSDTNLVSKMNTTVNGQPATVLTDSSGMSLYTFEQDSLNTSNCRGSCLTEWPPMHAPAGSTVASPFGVINGNDGQTQLTLNGLPLYHFSGDRKPGDTFGEYTGWDIVEVSN